MKTMFKIGDKVQILFSSKIPRSDIYFYKDGDKAVLIGYFSNNVWLASFRANAEYTQDGIWIVIGEDMELIEPKRD